MPQSRPTPDAACFNKVAHETVESTHRVAHKPIAVQEGGMTCWVACCGRLSCWKLSRMLDLRGNSCRKQTATA